MLRLSAGLVYLSIAAGFLVAQSHAPSTATEASTAESGRLISLDAQNLVLMNAGGKQRKLPLQPFTSLRRFGEPGAAPEEFQPGEQVRVTVSNGVVEQVSDEISDQIARKQPHRVVSQDREQYRFTVEPVDGATGTPQGERQTLGYGRPTFLVQRESPQFVFRVVEGARFWINRGAAAEGPDLVAREVLDDASRDRFARQQRLRTLARLEVNGAPARVLTVGATSTVQLGPDATAWGLRLKSGERVRVSDPAKPEGAQTTLLVADPMGKPPMLQLQGALLGLRAGSSVRVTSVRDRVSFQRDVEPILQVNCLPCHGGRGASGYSITDPVRLRAGGPRGKGIVPGKSSESLLYLTMTGEQNPRMPPDRDATREQLELLKRWIDAGASVEP